MRLKNPGEKSFLLFYLETSGYFLIQDFNVFPRPRPISNITINLDLRKFNLPLWLGILSDHKDPDSCVD